MIQELHKLAENDNIVKAFFPPKKKGKTTSQPHQESQTSSAMMVTSSNRSSTAPAKKLQSCRHCGKFIIHTDVICDVYNISSANIASSVVTDTPNMSVVFQNMKFGNDNGNLEYLFVEYLFVEYLFVNDFEDMDDLTLANFMKLYWYPFAQAQFMTSAMIT
jgi:hypothetical protein